MKIRISHRAWAAVLATFVSIGVGAGAAPAATAATPQGTGSAATPGFVTYTLPAPPTQDVTTAVTATPLASATGTPNTPNPIHFGGVPAVGALFNAPLYVDGKLTDAQHYCTASVVHSPHGDLLLTAAHCVYGSSGPATFLAFAPMYDNGPSPLGVWYVSKIEVTSGWAQNQDPSQDYAFLEVSPIKGRPIEQYTGSLQLTATRLPVPVAVIGYNDVQYDPQGNEPIVCLAKAFAVTEAGEPYSRFNCNNYQDGTSGGPWIEAGTNRVIGDIGGFDQGGDYPNYSFSSIFTQNVFDLYHVAGG